MLISTILYNLLQEFRTIHGMDPSYFELERDDELALGIELLAPVPCQPDSLVVYGGIPVFSHLVLRKGWATACRGTSHHEAMLPSNSAYCAASPPAPPTTPTQVSAVPIISIPSGFSFSGPAMPYSVTYVSRRYAAGAAPVPTKTKICECGKEKHGFASHSTWCDLHE